MRLRLHNSLTRRIEDFVPADPGRVTMYVCGPTVYNYVHIGNARPYVAFGLLARLLRRLYPNVVYARNITDVDDKINAAAGAAGVPDRHHHGPLHRRLSRRHGQDRRRRARCDAARHRPHRRNHRHVRALDRRGHAYAAEGHVLFDVTSYARVRPAVRPLDRRHDRRCARRGRAVQEESRRLRPVETVDAGLARLGEPLGPWTPRLAHRVLGDGREAPRRQHRHPRRRQRPDVPAPRERNRAEPPARMAAGSSRATGFTTAC